MLERLKNIIKEQNLFSSKDHLIIAVSGGVDSVVLCELCRQGEYNFKIAHCNFQLRGKESDRDEDFVKNLGTKYGVEVFVKKFDTENYAAEKKISIQEAARNLRYGWFAELIEKSRSESISTSNTSYLLTAHHADDNLETVLMNFTRGTGLHGLSGIPCKGNPGGFGLQSLYVRRPLLGFFKEEILSFAKEQGLEWVEDSSNESLKYTRNLFRNEIIPAIAKVYPEVKQNLVGNIQRFGDLEKLYQLSVAGIKKKLLKSKGNEYQIPVKQLMGFNNRALIYEIISDYGFSEKQVDELIKLMSSETGKYIVSPGNDWRIIRNRHWLIITPFNPEESSAIIIEPGDNEIKFALGKLSIYINNEYQYDLSKIDTKDEHSAVLDLDKIEFPLLLRKWKTGDYFYPLGMKKKKKISRFFIDQKFSKPAKESAWVIESNKKIIWIVDHRIDERFKLTDKTRKTIQLKLSVSK